MDGLNSRVLGFGGDFGDKMAGWFAMTLMALVNLFLSN